MRKLSLIKVIAFFYFGVFHSQTYPSWHIQLLKHFKPDIYFSGCWGWYDPVKNREYAISTSKKGTWFIDITQPTTAYIADSVIGIPINIWRELKNYKHYCYIISDDYMNTFQIIDMSYLPDSVHVIASPHKGLLRKGHTLWVDGHYLYVGGPRDSNNVAHNMGVFNLHPDPKNPQFLRWLDQDFPGISYVHDMFVRNDTVYASAANQGLQVFKYDSIQNKFLFISSLTNYLESGYNHSSALTQDGKTLVFMDEVPTGLSIKVTNVSTLTNMSVVNYLKPFNLNGFVAHNPFVLGNRFLIASCYQDGTLIYDISNPSTPTLTGYFDTYPQGGGHQSGNYQPGYDGNWGSYPFFPSGLILSNDMKNGIFILKPDSAYLTHEPTDFIQTSKLKIFPNPVHKTAYLNLIPESIEKITIYSLSGKIIGSLKPLPSPFGSKLEFPETQNIYFITVTTKNGVVYHEKIISTP